MESVGDSEDVKRLTCNHIFHKQCINRWQKGVVGDANKHCPLCRQSMSPPSFIGNVISDIDSLLQQLEPDEREREIWIEDPSGEYNQAPRSLAFEVSPRPQRQRHHEHRRDPVNVEYENPHHQPPRCRIIIIAIRTSISFKF